MASAQMAATNSAQLQQVMGDIISYQLDLWKIHSVLKLTHMGAVVEPSMEPITLHSTSVACQ